MKIPYTKPNQETDKLKNSGLILGNEKRTSGAFETIWESIIYFVVGVALSGQQTLVELHASRTNEDVRMYIEGYLF